MNLTNYRLNIRFEIHKNLRFNYFFRKLKIKIKKIRTKI